MKKIVYGILATLSGLVLLFSYKTSHEAVMAVAGETTPATTSTTAPSTSSGSTGTSTDESSSSSSGSAGSSSSTGSSSSSDSTSSGTSSSTGLTDGTYTGAAANTRYGAVQVQITVSGGVITDVQVPEYPSSNPKDQQINQRALPTLISETTSAQSSNISMVSGATYTSQGYIQSLQSAIDQAKA